MSDWTVCKDKLPDPVDPKDSDMARVILATGTNRDPGLLPVDAVNGVWFNLYWEDHGYTHWMYCPDPPRS